LPKFISNKVPSYIKLCGVVLLLVLSFGLLHKMFRPRAQYPVSYADVPAGISAFLNQINAGGKVFNYPNHGGYFQWELGYRYKIYMDLEMMLFSDEDFFYAYKSFLDRKALGKMIEQYRPGFIVPTIRNRRFKEIIKQHPDYRPVFFDDAAVLYADRQQHPEIVEHYSLEAIQPTALAGINLSQLTEDEAGAMFSELRRVEAIYPGSMRVNEFLGKFALGQKDYDKALWHAEKLISGYPDKQVGFQLQGDIYFDQGKFNRALLGYEKALKVALERDKPELNEKISKSYNITGDSE
jgi:tetratricopeptide (TPR) repeat protein